MAADDQTICLKLSIDLATALRSRAASENLTISDVLRSMVMEWVYDERPSVDDGYKQGRSIAMKVAHQTVTHLIADRMPDNFEDAMALINSRRG
jgi:hypothetical protein